MKGAKFLKGKNGDMRGGTKGRRIFQIAASSVFKEEVPSLKINCAL